MKAKCEECDGDGMARDFFDRPSPFNGDCPNCKGKGWVKEQDNPTNIALKSAINQIIAPKPKKKK